jgi:TRAP-type C4-dicarboxylate transport system permease small subunit
MYSSLWPRLNSFFNRLEEILLVFLLVLMVFLAFLPIVFRNVIATGLIWIDPLLRHLVLWVALLGASMATRQERHIKIDLLSNHLPASRQRVVQGGLDFLAALVCLSLVGPGIDFVRDEAQAGKFLILGIPLWVSQAIIPVMLGVIGARFVFAGWRHLRHP